MGRHVKEEKVDDDPEQENLDEIEDVNGVKTKRLEVRFEKKRQASGAKPEYGDEDGEIFEKWRRVGDSHVQIEECSNTKENKRGGHYITEISREVSRASGSSQDKVEAKKVE